MQQKTLAVQRDWTILAWVMSDILDIYKSLLYLSNIVAMGGLL